MDVSADLKITLIGRSVLNYNKDSEVDKLCIKPTYPCSQFIAYGFVWIWVTGLNFSIFTVFYFCFIFLRQIFLTDTSEKWRKLCKNTFEISMKSYIWGEANVRQWQDNQRKFSKTFHAASILHWYCIYDFFEMRKYVSWRPEYFHSDISLYLIMRGENTCAVT